MSAEAARLKVQVGGAVDSRRAVYIVRPSDDELLGLLEQGEYCNVLCSRQMGKTSLLHRTRGRLAEKDVRSALVDVAGALGKVANADDWYRGLIQEIANELELSVDTDAWWRACKAVTPNQRLIQFFREEVAPKVDGRAVIFLDEIDSTLALPYTDDLFVAIRSMYNDRVREPAYEKLVFCLVGVATPNELIKDPRTTPYNVGKTLELRDFDPERDDLQPLYRSVGDDPSSGEAVVRAVLKWTGGHPYLTLRLCEECARRRFKTAEEVDRLVEEMFPSLQAVEQDTHFQQVLRFVGERVDAKLEALLLYRRVWRGRREPDRTTLAHIHLKLAGVVKRDAHGMLAVRNAIYRRIFTGAWAKAATPAPERRVRTARQWAVALAMLVLVSPGLYFELLYPRQHIETLSQALDDYALAREAYEKLRKVPFRAAQADALWVDFFERRALRAEQEGKRDEALLWWLKALAAQATIHRARRVGQLIGADDSRLLMTFRGSRPSFIGKAVYLANLQILAFSPDGKVVLTASDNNTARLWSASDGHPIGKPLQHGDWVLAAAFSPDGRAVLTGSSDKTARLWRALDGSSIGQPLRHDSIVSAVAFSPDGKSVLTGSGDKTARLWSALDGSSLGTPLEHDAAVSTVAFSPDGKILLTGTGHGTAQLWRTYDRSRVGKPLHHELGVSTVAFSPDGKVVITGSDDNTARLWSTRNGSPIGQPLRHDGLVFALAFSPDGRSVVTGSIDNTARLWSTLDGGPIGKPLRHDGSVHAVAFSPDGKAVLTGSSDTTARLWSALDGSLISKPLLHRSGVYAVAFSPDGRFVLTGSADRDVRLWRNPDGSPLGKLLSHDDSVRAVAFGPDGKAVLTGSADNTARLWSALDGSPIGKPLQHGDWVRAVAFSPDGKTVLTGGDGKTARLWSALDGSSIGKPLQHGDWVRAVAFSPDGKTVLTGSDDKTARLWSALDGSPIGEPLHHDGSVRAVAFSPSGKVVLTGSDDNTARPWSALDGSPVGKPLRHDSGVSAVAFSPDGKAVLTGSADNTARLWSALDGSPLGQPLRHDASVSAVAFSPDGKTMLAATQWWVHVARFDGSEAKPLVSRLLPFPFRAAQFADSAGSHVQLAVAPTGDSIQILKIQPEVPEAEPIQGDPKQLLEEWQKKLGLRITEAGEIEAVR